MKKAWDMNAVSKAAKRGLAIRSTDGKPLDLLPYQNSIEVPRKNKYGNKKVEIDGILFDSILEGSRYTELKYMKQAGEIKSFEIQVTFSLNVHDYHICDYRADFVVKYPDGHEEVEDTKGVETPKFIIQKKLMLAIYGIKIILIRKQHLGNATKSKKPKARRR